MPLVARNGFVEHYTPFRIPTGGMLLNPKTDLNALNAVC